MMKTTTEGNGSGALLRRMLMVLMVAALMATIMALAAAPAMSKANPPSCEEGQSRATDNQPAGTDRHGKHVIKIIECAKGLPPSA